MRKTKKLFIALIAAVMAVSLGSIPAQAHHDPMPRKVSIRKPSIKVMQGRKFEIKAVTAPRHAEDDYLRWEIISGKKCVRFEEYDDRDGDDMDFIALKPGKAKIRCYVRGRNKQKYGDVITVTVKKRASDYSFSRDGQSTVYEEAYDDFDLEVRKGHSIKNSELKWKIIGKDVLSFATRRKTGTSVDFIAKKPGKAKVVCTCTNKKAKRKSVTFTVIVEEDDDDYYDDDYDYDGDDEDDYDDGYYDEDYY